MPEKSGLKSGKPGTFRKGKDRRRGRGPKPGAPNAGRPTNKARGLAQDVTERGLAEMRRRMGPKLIQKLEDGTVKAFTETGAKYTLTTTVKLEAQEALAALLGVDVEDLPPLR